MLKNYTSQVSASRSVAYIEACLTKNGARQILKEYDHNGQIDSICFIVPVDGVDMPFKLPARISECERVLRANISRRARPETIKKIPKQAVRTAWKILSDWVEAQMAMIELAQVELTEVFMPYIYNIQLKQTYFEMIKGKGFKALLPGNVEVNNG